jgi:hypothetical protein
MLRSAYAAALVGLTALLGPLAAADDAKKPARVGRLIIEGNVTVRDHVILDMLDLRPGQILDYREVRAAPGRIARLGLFDPAELPIVEVLPNEFDSAFLDVRVRVKERDGRPADLRFRAEATYHAFQVAHLCGWLSHQLGGTLNPWPRAAPDR